MEERFCKSTTFKIFLCSIFMKVLECVLGDNVTKYQIHKVIYLAFAWHIAFVTKSHIILLIVCMIRWFFARSSFSVQPKYWQMAKQFAQKLYNIENINYYINFFRKTVQQSNALSKMHVVFTLKIIVNNYTILMENN